MWKIQSLLLAIVSIGAWFAVVAWSICPGLLLAMMAWSNRNEEYRIDEARLEEAGECETIVDIVS